MSEQKATNVHWHGGEINRPERAQLLGHGSATLWFTGLSGSGKSTIAVALEQALYQRGVLVYRLDGDNIRLGINKNLGFSAEDRAENIRRVGEVSKLFVDGGVIVLSSFISPYLVDRQIVRELHEAAESKAALPRDVSSSGLASGAAGGGSATRASSASSAPPPRAGCG